MASCRRINVLNNLFRSLEAPSPFVATSVLRPYPRLPRSLQPAQTQFARRYAHQVPKPGRPIPPAGKHDDSNQPTKSRKLLEPHYELTFTCIPCSDRSTHVISKQGYHKGSVLITCPSCRNRHVISDHLDIFGDRKLTVEDLMREKGQLVKRGTLGVDGDIEFWEDGTQTERTSASPTAARGIGAPIAEEDCSVLREAHDLSATAATPSAAASAPLPLSGSGSRPQSNDTTSISPKPSTRRQFHHRARASRDDLGIDEKQLSDLRESLRRMDEETQSQALETTQPKGPKVTFMIRKIPTSLHEPPSKFDKPPDSLAREPLPPSKIPQAHLRMLQRGMTSSRYKDEEPLTPISIISVHHRRSAPAGSQILDSDKRPEPELKPFYPPKAALGHPRRTEPHPHHTNYNNRFRKLHDDSSEFRSVNRNLPNMALLMADDARNPRRILDTAEGETWTPVPTDGLGWFSKEDGFKAMQSRKQIPPQNKFEFRRVRIVKSGLKFKTEHYDASLVENRGNASHGEFMDASLKPRMLRLPRGDPSKQKTVQAWPEGANEPIEVQVNNQGSLHYGMTQMRPIAQKPPQFRKLVPKEKNLPMDKNAPIDPDTFTTQMGRAKMTPQRPLPEEKYERFTKDVEAAKKLPKQHVQLNDYDIYGEDHNGGADYLV